MSYRNGNDELSGLSVDILRSIAETEDWELTFEGGTREDCRSWLEEGAVDMIVGMEGPDNTMNHTKFSNGIIISNWGVLYTAKGVELDSIIDLEHKWVGVVKDDIYYSGESGLKELLDSFKIESFLVEFNNYNELIKAMEEKQIDAGLLNHLLGQVVEDEKEMSRTGIVLNHRDLRFAYPANGSKTLVLSAIMDERLQEMKSDQNSIYYSLLEDYIEGEGGSEVKEIFPQWLFNLFLLVLGIALLLFAITMFLRYRVRAKTRELTIANMQLDRDIQRRREVERRLKDERNRSVFYLDLLVHDVGNINQGLLNSSQIYNMVKNDREKADNVHRTIEQLVKRSVGLLKNVHKFAQATTAPYNPEPIDLMHILKKGLAGVILSFPEMEINFDIRGPEENIIIPAEPLLEEVFYNIFHNAVKYHELGDPKIEVKVSINKDNSKAVVVIEDRGRGIPDNMKGDLFSRMSHADQAKHLGMGLSLVKVLLDRYGSTIRVEDRVPGDHKKGSRFIVTLPVINKVEETRLQKKK